MAKIKKRGRGRPGRMDKLLYDLQVNVLKGQEDLASVYSEAVQLLIDTMRSEKASVTNKLSAAKTIKEYVEASLEAYEEDDEDENKNLEEDEKGNSTSPIFKID